MQRERETKAMHLMTHTPWETITLTTLSRDRDLFVTLLQEARDLSVRQKEGKLVIHTAWGTEWRPFGKPRRKRPLDSVVLADGVSDRISSDIATFLARRAWYTERGTLSKIQCTVCLPNIDRPPKGFPIEGATCSSDLQAQESHPTFKPWQQRTIMTSAFSTSRSAGSLMTS